MHPIRPLQDRDIRSTVYRVSGAVPAGNYIQVPRAGAHSLGLTGRYVYFLFKPMATKYFVVHMEAGTREGVAVRVSFSNLVKELKSTSTWLQFPFASAPSSSTDPTSRWAVLTVDLQSALATFFNRTYMCLKNVKVCANVLIKGVFTSNQEYSPQHQMGQPCSLAAEPLPREMRFFLPKGAQFSDHYSSFSFPAKQPGSYCMTGTSVRPTGHVPQPHSPLYPAAVRPEQPPTVTVTSPSRRERRGGANKDTSRTAKEGLEASPPHAPASTRQIVITRHRLDEQQSTSVSVVASWANSRPAGSVCICALLQDAPLLQLERVVGLDGCTSCPVLFSANGKETVFACHCTVVALDTTSRGQRFFAGHSDKVWGRGGHCTFLLVLCAAEIQVSSLALSTSGLLVSGQGGVQAVVRVWQFSTAQCLALFKAHHSALHELRCVGLGERHPLVA